MTARMRALVQRPRRKVHFASIGAGETEWFTICDRKLPVEGTAHRGHDWAAFVSEQQLDDGAMCRTCWGPLVLAGLAVEEARQQWEAERRSLVTTVNDLYLEAPRLAVAS